VRQPMRARSDVPPVARLPEPDLHQRPLRRLRLFRPPEEWRRERRRLRRDLHQPLLRGPGLSRRRRLRVGRVRRWRVRRGDLHRRCRQWWRE
jgi:hypothetical protein